MGFFDSSSSTTTNKTDNYDQRQVNTSTDSNNVAVSVNKSVNTNNLLDGGAIAAMADVSTRAIASAAQQTMDNFGFTAGALDSGYKYADHIFDSSIGFANNVNATASDAYARAAQLSNDSLTGAQASYREATKQVAGAYSTALDSTAAAYADAKGTTSAQKQIILAVLAVAAVFALVALKNKG